MSLNVPSLDELSLPDVPKCAADEVLFFETGWGPIDDLMSKV